ncbi:hypothetical protein Hypma_008171 [Hypsizygus marmoreus]|uniref:Uncharacterized protein n=1 Tax=Hypsizygus marmoreus TaxID=39966 RepID=A0A369JWD3_HYPMA|nr:hypothetical protein Hypma_008171 [Hypsizygus marmoreus]
MPAAVDEIPIDLTATTSGQETTSGAICGHGSCGCSSHRCGSHGHGHARSEGGTQSHPPVEQATEDDGVWRSSHKHKEPDAPTPALLAKRNTI